MGVVSERDFEDIIKKRFSDKTSVKRGKIPYYHNYLSLKKYDDGFGHIKYRLVYMPSVKVGDVKYDFDIKAVNDRADYIRALTRGYALAGPDDVLTDDGNYMYSEKLKASLCRSKGKIFDLAFCNPWEYFFTGTFDGKKIDDRSDLDAIHKKFSKFVKNANHIHSCDIKFLVVPELHSDGINWHFHGFIMGIPDDCLIKMSLNDYIPMRLKDEILKGFDIYSWKQFQRSFGWNTLEPIKNHEAVAKYCTKYITKAVIDTNISVGGHVYYRSRGLSSGQVIKEGLVNLAFVNAFNWDSENDFCKVANILPEEVPKILKFFEKF